MSQMLVRIDEETDKALTYIYNHNGTVSLNEVAVVMGIVRRIYEQWKPNHEAMLKIIEGELHPIGVLGGIQKVMEDMEGEE